MEAELKKCSTCGSKRPLDAFDGKATCNTCRPKKRKQRATKLAENKTALKDLQQEVAERDALDDRWRQ